MNSVDTELEDWRALCLFETRPAERAEIVGGIATALGTVILAPLILALASLVAGSLRSQPTIDPADIEVVETRFVKLGRPLDPQRLPDRDVPQVQPEAAAPTTTEEPQAPATEKPSPSNLPSKEEAAPAADDLLNQLSERAGALADSNQSGAETEGHADGIAEGQELEDLQNLYHGKLYAYFRKGWQAPTQISDSDLQKLSCVVDIEISEDARMQSFKIARPSGNEAFDESVQTRMTQALDAALPSPPDNVAKQFLGQIVSLRFLGRHLR